LWFLDRVAEWFPFLADRGSLTTVQGLEWASPGVFVSRLGEIGAVKSVQQNAPEAAPALVRERYCGADYVAVFFPPDAPERQSFWRSPSFQPVFANERASVLRVKPADLNCRSAAGPR
jgi:hypothetical protein